MDTATVINLAYAAAALAAGLGLLWLTGPRRPSNAQRTAADSYEGPDSLRLLEDLEAHMKAYGRAIADFYEPAGPPPSADPAWDAGLERLWDAARDNHDHPRGDS